MAPKHVDVLRDVLQTVSSVFFNGWQGSLENQPEYSSQLEMEPQRPICRVSPIWLWVKTNGTILVGW